MADYDADDVANRYLQMHLGGATVSAKSQYTLSHLLGDITGPGITEDVIKSVWFGIADFVVETLAAKKKGVVVPGLATFSLFKKTFQKVFRPAPSFKSELSCMLPPNAPELPCMQLPLTVIAVKAAVSQDKVEAVLKRVIMQLGHQARNGANLSVPLGGLGVFWSRANSFGFNFNRKPQMAEERKLTLRERALAKKRAAEEAEAEAEAAAEYEEGVDAEQDRLGAEMGGGSNNQDGNSTGLDSGRDALDEEMVERQLDREVLDGQGKMSMDEILEK